MIRVMQQTIVWYVAINFRFEMGKEDRAVRNRVYTDQTRLRGLKNGL